MPERGPLWGTVHHVSPRTFKQNRHSQWRVSRLQSPYWIRRLSWNSSLDNYVPLRLRVIAVSHAPLYVARCKWFNPPCLPDPSILSTPPSPKNPAASVHQRLLYVRTIYALRSWGWYLLHNFYHLYLCNCFLKKLNRFFPFDLTSWIDPFMLVPT